MALLAHASDPSRSLHLNLAPRADTVEGISTGSAAGPDPASPCRDRASVRVSASAPAMAPPENNATPSAPIANDATNGRRIRVPPRYMGIGSACSGPVLNRSLAVKDRK